MGVEASLLSKRFIKGGYQYDGLDILGEVKPFKQDNTMFPSPRLLKVYSELGLTSSLRLQSVGSSYDGILYKPALLNADLAWPKMRKYFPKKREIDLFAWNTTKLYLYEHLSALGSFSTIPVSLLRDHVLENMDPQDLKGSAGFSFPHVADKKTFVEKHFDVYLRAHPSFALGIASVWRIFIKEELREGHKVDIEPSSRTIFGSSALIFLAGYRLYKNLSDGFMNMRDRLWSSVGLDFSGSEYGITMSRFADKTLCSVDGSSFDASQQAEDLIDLFEVWDMLILDECKTPDYYRDLVFLLCNEVYSICVLPDGKVLQKGCGNATGSFMTIIRNTCHNFRLYAYVFIKACEKFGVEPTYDAFMSKHHALMNGDDCIITTSRFMNFALIKEFMTPFLEISSISYKGSCDIPFWQATYCGCTPVEYKGNIVPLRNSYKMLLGLYYMNADETDESLEERVLGYMNCNPFDGLFVHYLREISRLLSLPLIDIQPIIERFLYLKGVARVKPVTQINLLECQGPELLEVDDKPLLKAKSQTSKMKSRS